MTRRMTAALCAAFALGGTGLLCGCASDKGGSRVTSMSAEYIVVVDNESKQAVQVDWAVSLRRVDSGEVGKASKRPLGVIAPGASAHDATTYMNFEDTPGYVFVFRMRLTVPSASWQEPAVMWWEVIGDLPKKFVIENGPGPDGFKVKLRAEGAAIEAVPRQLWGDDDTESADNR